MRKVALGSITTINPRKPKNLDLTTICTFVPMESVDEYLGAMIGEETRMIGNVVKGYTYFSNGDVLFAKITPCMENGKCALANDLAGGIGFGSTEFHIVRAGASIIPEWIYYFLRQESVRKEAERHMTGSAGQKRVPTSFLDRIEIPLPPLEEQRRIAGILGQADRLRRLRRYALELSEGYLQAVFLEMFWTNQQPSWPVTKIGKLAKPGKNTIRTGPFGSQLLHSEFVNQGIAVLGIDNAVQNRFAWSKLRYISPEKYRKLRRYTVFPGDVIVTIMGTVGRCAVVPDEIPTAINTKHLCCITCDQSKCLPVFLKWAFLTHPSVRQQLGDAVRGAIMPGLNMGIIKDLEFPLPPLVLQQQFEYVVRNARRLYSRQREALRQAEHLFQALLQRAFRGEM